MTLKYGRQRLDSALWLEHTGVGFEVFRRHHDDEADAVLVLEHLERPATHRPHAFYRRDAIIGNEHL